MAGSAASLVASRKNPSDICASTSYRLGFGTRPSSDSRSCALAPRDREFPLRGNADD